MSRLRRIACFAACLALAGFTALAHAQETIEPDPKPVGVAPAAPAPAVISVPGAAPPPEAAAEPEAPPFKPDADTVALPRSGVGGVIVEQGQGAVDISNAVSRYLPPDAPEGDAFASYLIDFVNRTPVRQTRILVLDPGIYGGPGAPPALSAPDLVTVLSSDAAARVEVIETGARTRVRLDLPAETTVTTAFRYAGPLNTLTVEMWEERALARFQTAALVIQGALLGLLTALGAWLTGIAILRRDRMASWLAALFGMTFLALLFGFGFAGPFALAGIVTSAGLALGLFAGAAALALAFVVHALAPDGRWRSFAWFAEYVPWLVAAAGLAVLFNAPYAAVVAKAGAIWALVLAVGVIFARAWEGDGIARRLTLAAILVLLAFAPLAMQESLQASGRVTMLAASSLLAAGLLLAAFAVSAGAPKALRQRVDWVMAQAVAPRDAPPLPAALAAIAPATGDESRYGLALAAAHQGLWDWDLKRDRLFLSPSVEALLGARLGQLQASDRDWTPHIHPDDLATFLGALEDYRKLGDVSFALDFRARGYDGLNRWVQLRASFMSDGDRAARCIGLVSDVSAQKEGEALLLASARQDSVTGLANRAWFLEALGHRLGYATAERRFALLTVDIARFRTVNESLGHAAGDALLAALADRLRATAPEGALTARLGGDVFGLLWLTPGDDAAAESAKFVLDTLGVPVEVEGRMMTPIARGGLVMLDGAQADSATALADAEAALAEARRPGAAGFMIFKAAMRDAKADRAALERDLAGALERSEIVVHYQPVIRVRDRRLAGLEALVRWAHPVRGLLTAETFAPLAEETGLIDQIGRFVLETAARDAARWRRMAPDSPLFVNVNVSARQLGDNVFLQFCDVLALDIGVRPAEVRLEITETLAIDDSGAAATALQRLRRAGFGLIMDDFGAGHSTLSRLARLPFDAVKIDGSFLRSEGTARNVLAGLIRLARDLGLEATAEGVESEEDFAFLAAQDCPYAQGYHCGRPSDATATQRLLLDLNEPADAVE
ncbi:hypothetical protein sos41_33960 [Alphaproteobacteria bacterium SO-S41]|nr:hypothetical protein sos41_33960 [Alphaproteobacteria bacterium SO-S41]